MSMTAKNDTPTGAAGDPVGEGAGDNCPIPDPEPKPGIGPLDTQLGPRPASPAPAASAGWEAPCSWAGGNDTCYCRTCGEEYRYGREDKPACPKAALAPAAPAPAASAEVRYAEERRDHWLNEAQRLALLVRTLGGDPDAPAQAYVPDPVGREAITTILRRSFGVNHERARVAADDVLATLAPAAPSGLPGLEDIAKEPGRTAYAGYCSSLDNDADRQPVMPPWDMLKATSKRCWADAEQHVADAILAARPVAEGVAQETRIVQSAFGLGARVRKISGASWQGFVCGHYSTALTPDGVCVESEREAGSVQLYPTKALEGILTARALTSTKGADDGQR